MKVWTINADGALKLIVGPPTSGTVEVVEHSEYERERAGRVALERPTLDVEPGREGGRDAG